MDAASTELWIGVGVATAVVAVVVGYLLFFHDKAGTAPLPGKLLQSGTFQLPLVNFDDESLVEERQRDFMRTCAAQKDLHFLVLKRTIEYGKNEGKVLKTELKLLELKDTSSFAACMTSLREADFFQTEGAKLFQESGVYSLVSATTPFDFSMKFGVIPMFHDPKYVILYHEDTKQFQILWGAWINDKAEPVPANKRWPFFVWYVSQPLGMKPPAEISFSYGAIRNTKDSVMKNIEVVCAEMF
ncbi:unnamed protein product [Amoebophrya sp. A120]|nr:unnamed protein product [Amoebophrya sp. A120]|eukprot:GSA120T00019962001.1